MTDEADAIRSLQMGSHKKVSSFALRLSQGFGGFVPARRGGPEQKKEASARAGRLLR